MIFATFYAMQERPLVGFMDLLADERNIILFFRRNAWSLLGFQSIGKK